MYPQWVTTGLQCGSEKHELRYVWMLTYRCHWFGHEHQFTTEEVDFSSNQDGHNDPAKKRYFDDAQEPSNSAVDALNLIRIEFDCVALFAIRWSPSTGPVITSQDLIPSENAAEDRWNADSRSDKHSSIETQYPRYRNDIYVLR